ncbi:unnamed protein product [Brassica oleracea var. botrytis]
MEVEKRIMVNGSMKLPVGYRFHPTEQELILHYLLPKAFSSPLPSSIIPVFDVFFSHPLTFPGLYLSVFLLVVTLHQIMFSFLSYYSVWVFHFSGDQEERQRYFFSKKRQEVSSNDHRIKISSGNGYWKPIRKERGVIACGRTVGIRRTLVFYGTNSSSSSSNKIRWCMTEYCLAGFSSTKVFGGWAVYKVYKRKEPKGRRQRKSRVRDAEEEEFTIGSNHEFGPPPPSPPTSADESGSII